jgi:hypothetical protein
VRFPEKDVGDLIIRFGINGQRSKPICSGDWRQSKVFLAIRQIFRELKLPTFSTESTKTGLMHRSRLLVLAIIRGRPPNVMISRNLPFAVVFRQHHE